MIKDFFYLQRNDRQALLIILAVLIAIILLVMFLGRERQATPSISSTDSTSIQQASQKHPLYYKVDNIPHELFTFDPNTADSTTLLRLGLNGWQVRSIYRYRAKGGIYHTANDFAQLYGLTKKQFEILRPFIRISEDYQPASKFYHQERNYPFKRKEQQFSTSHANETTEEKNIYSYPQKIKPGQYIPLNTADTTELKKIPGIGSGYAKAIIRYREQLGGFASTHQLLEIEGFPEQALSFIHLDDTAIRKININQLSLNQLRRHPYINFYQAKEICDYRRLRGPIKSLQDLKLLHDFPPAEIERLQPYVTF